MSVNTSAPRVENLSHTRQYWDDYIPVSRNLKRMRDTAGESIERLATGPEEIKAIWDKLPATRHTLDDPSLWSLDMWPTPVRPGIDGLIIMVHGEFEEANKLSGNVMKRSFDRTFTIVPVGNGEVKVANDMLVIRSYSGAEGWKVNEAAIQQQAMQQQQVPPQTVQQPVQPPAQQLPAAAAAAPQNPAVQHTPQQIAEMQEKVRMFAEKTGLTLQYAEMCVSSSNWDLAAAWEQMTVAKVRNF